MPKLGMEPIRRAALIHAAIEEIGEAGSIDVTVGRIARRAGVSSGLAHHYFGGKEDLMLAAMRHALSGYGQAVRRELAEAGSPAMRLRAIVAASFAPEMFAPATVSAWMQFYLFAASSPDARRLLRVYHRRLDSNLCHALRPLVGPRAPSVAARTAALIDGIYLRQALGAGATDGETAAARVTEALDREIGET